MSEDNNTASTKRNASASSALDLIDLMYKLKTTKRTGWVLKGVQGPESIADHMYRMSMMAMLACATERSESKSGSGTSVLDANRCIKMALVHDLAESIVGDFTPHCRVSKEEKYRLEREAVAKIRVMVDEAVGKRNVAAEEGAKEESEGNEENDLGLEIERLWLEYEQGATPEALLVKDLDKLEMIAQAYEYEEDQSNLDLEDFFRSTAGKFVTETGKAWAEEIVRRRISVLQSRRKGADSDASEPQDKVPLDTAVGTKRPLDDEEKEKEKEKEKDTERSEGSSDEQGASKEQRTA